MKTLIEEANGRTSIRLHAETVEEAALLVRMGLRRKRDLDLSIYAENNGFSARLVAEHHRVASNRIPVSRY